MDTMLENKCQVSGVKCQISGIIKAISVSKEKGTKKQNVLQAILKKDYGIIGDAHAGNWHRQVSLLAGESIDKIKKRGLNIRPGDFAENITTQGLNLCSLKLGTKLKVGKSAILEVSQIGKVCHTRCNIYYKTGDCIMPREGIFAKVLKGGVVKVGDKVKI